MKNQLTACPQLRF